MATPANSIDPNLTINEIVLRFPGALTVLHDAGLDTCCGGGLPLVEAAARHRLDLPTLLDKLTPATEVER